VPETDKLTIVLHGELAAILRFSLGKKTRPPIEGRGPGELATASIGGCGARNTRFLRLVEREFPRLLHEQISTDPLIKRHHLGLDISTEFFQP
jgi:hypothetical protein